MLTLDEFRYELNNPNLSEEMLLEMYENEKMKHNSDVDALVNQYEKLDMDAFIKRIGGPEKIEEMRKINDLSDKLDGNGKKIVLKKSKEDEWKEQWKQGFMEGFEEAYKRITGGK